MPLRQEGNDLSGAILDVAGTVLFAIDMEGRVIRWNQAAAALTGLPAERIEGSIFHKTLIFPDDIDRWKREFERIAAGSPPRHFEIRWKIHSGSVHSVTCSCAAIRDSEGNVEYIVCAVIDNLSCELMTDRTAELRDISRFLHDTISQDLVALSFNVSKLEFMALDLMGQTAADSAMKLVDRCCRDIRLISYMLEPPSLSETRLDASIEQYAGYLRKETGLTIRVDFDAAHEAVSTEAQLVFFAAVQVWVAGAIRSRPKADISIRLRSGGAATVLELEMICAAPVLSTLPGLAVIRERARALGGEFEPGGDATRLFATISLPDQGSA
jgi:PAS domain S-box-containing protein